MGVVTGGGGGGGGGPAAGSYLPTAAASGITVDSTTYANTLTGSGKFKTLVAPADTGALALAISGDAYPRVVIPFDPSDIGLILFGDGSVEPVVHGAAIGGDQTHVRIGTAAGAAVLTVGSDDAPNRPSLLASSDPLQVSGSLMIAAGANAPAIGGNVGDLYIRSNPAGDSTYLYRCTSPGAAGVAVWAAVTGA